MSFFIYDIIWLGLMNMVKIKKKQKKKKFIVIVLLLLIGSLVFFAISKGKNNDAVLGNVLHKEKKRTLKVIDLDSDSRPLAIMINNHPEARKYHTGLQEAYIVYEIIVEGGYTRLMGIYKDANLEKVGSIRSARHYFLDYALENDAIFVHWGWSPQAEVDITKLGMDNINGLSYEDVYFYRDNNLNVAYEHRGFKNSQLLNEAIKKLRYRQTTNVKSLLDYSIDEVDLSSDESAMVANNVSINYSNLVMTSYSYDATKKVYLRSVNDEKHVDYKTKEQYTAKNIIVYQVENHKIANDGKGRQDLENIGSGTGFYITDGYAIPIKWEKGTRSAQTKYLDLNGNEIKLNDGNTFIQIQPSGKELMIS